jgi:hypothetical protein
MIDDRRRTRPGGRSGTRRSAGERVQGETVLVDHLGEWLPGTVLWEYRDTGRPRALVRFETAAGLVIRQLRWIDELRPCGRVIELPLVTYSGGRDESRSRPPPSPEG